VLRAVGARLLWPFRRFFDPRFRGIEDVVAAKHEDLAERVDLVHRSVELMNAHVAELTATLTVQLQEFRSLLAAAIDTTNESNIVIGRTLAELVAASEEIEDVLVKTRRQLDDAANAAASDVAVARAAEAHASDAGRG
jgi:hypothetical protein